MRFDPRKETKDTVGKYLELFTPEVKDDADFYHWVEIAKKYKLRSYFVYAQWIPMLAEALKGTGIHVGTGINFPLGNDFPSVKAKSVEEAIKNGCTSIDFVMNYRALNSGHEDLVREEFRLFKSIAKDVETKVIVECCYLSDDRLRQACDFVAEAGIGWVKTATGQYQGPHMDQCAIILDQLKGTGVRLKVSGVKFPRPQNAYAFLTAGAEIIGTQGVVEVIEGLDKLRALGILPAYEG